MRRSRKAMAVALALALLALVVFRFHALFWRSHLVVLKATGQLSDVTWTELGSIISSHAPGYLPQLLGTHSGYQSITVSDSSSAAIIRGKAGFERQCSSCHGIEARGGSAPSLVGHPLLHGDGDWALFRAISRGVAGTAMPAFRLPGEERWSLVAYLRTLRTTASDPVPGIGSLTGFRDVTPEDLVAGRADSANWLSYAGAYDGWRYSKLSQIDRKSVARLRLLWIRQLIGSERLETLPLAVDGKLFVTTPENGVRALDAESGAVLWSYYPLVRPVTVCCGKVNRGLALLGHTLYLATLDARLLAIDARTGKKLWDVSAADPKAGYSFTSAPLVVGDLILIGSAGGENPTRGFIDAYDAGTGARRWRFYTIPERGKPGNESWSGDSWKTGGGAPWLTGSYDPTLGLVYWGVGNPNPDYNGSGRLGDNLYTCSVVALDAKTGALRWYFQFTPHDEFDWDSAQTPVLVDTPGSPGETLLLWANRNGFYYVLNRATGKFLRAQPFVEQTWALELDSTGRPKPRPGALPSAQGTLIYPSHDGATNWWPPSYSPRTGSFYLVALERGDLYFRSAPSVDGAGFRYGSTARPGESSGGRMVIRALDGLSGKLRWEFTVANHPGQWLPNIGGLLSTAGDVLFGAAEDRFLALDATNGKVLWGFNTGGGIHNAAVTYLVKGKQRVTVAAGQAILTFGLEEQGSR